MQLPLFDDARHSITSRTMARRTDPDTSREAAEAAAASGSAASQRGKVLELLQQHDGSTSAELGQIYDRELRSDQGRWVCARRLPELARQVEVRRGEKRRCRANGTAAITWWVV